jgi:hypothetical protein
MGHCKLDEIVPCFFSNSHLIARMNRTHELIYDLESH